MFYDINRYLTDKYFDMVWGCHHPGTPQSGPLKINFLNYQIYDTSVDIQ